ncbi:CHAT domain-containing protein [Fortiea sp. LEGE XX443]|nr:CHAT domain-containing protein [Fortiea sp. LEGE XX443]
MKKFYIKILKQKLTTAAALQAAQLGMWQEQDYSKPYYLAAFTLQGE